MRKTSLWSLYIGVYTIPAGFVLLFLPQVFTFIQVAPADDPWLRFSGAIFMALGYFNIVLFRERPLAVMAAVFICHTVFTVFIGTLAVLQASPILYVVTVVMLIGTVGSTLTYFAERRSYTPTPFQRKPRTRMWNLYVAIYTLLFGVLPVLLPSPISFILGFERPEGLWVIISGMGFLVLSSANFVTYAQQGPATVILAILHIRLWFILVLIAMIVLGYPPRIALILLIVLVGVVGTIRTYRLENEGLVSSRDEVR